MRVGYLPGKGTAWRLASRPTRACILLSGARRSIVWRNNGFLHILQGPAHQSGVLGLGIHRGKLPKYQALRATQRDSPSCLGGVPITHDTLLTLQQKLKE